MAPLFKLTPLFVLALLGLSSLGVSGPLTPVLSYDASLGGQSLPEKVVPGSSFPIQITFKNTGHKTWKRGSISLALAAPQGAGIPAFVELDRGERVSTGQSKSFTFVVKAPLKLVRLNLSWQMVRNKKYRFGTPSPVNTVTVEQKYHIGAWYFATWNHKTNDIQPNQSKRIYGSWDQWGGVRQHALGIDPWKLGIDYSAREPLLGFYDQMSQKVVDAQISQAASRGLTYFAYYYYWNSDLNAEAGSTVPIQNFVTSKEKQKMKFVLAPIITGRRKFTLEMWEKSVVPRIADYATDSSYLTTHDGRPIVFLFDVPFKTTAERTQGVKTLRKEINERSGKSPLILFLLFPEQEPDLLKYYISHVGFDGFFCFTLLPGGPGTDFNTDARLEIDQLNRYPLSDPFVPCGSVGQDTRPWWKIGWGPWDFWDRRRPRTYEDARESRFFPTINDRPFHINMTNEGFERSLGDIRGYLDQAGPKTQRMLTLYAWNEWGEAESIEPSKVHGYAALDSIQRAFELVPLGPAPPVSDNRATFLNFAIPEKLAAGETRIVSVTFRNTGINSWSKHDGFFLSTQMPESNQLWGPSRANFGDNDITHPGENKTFTISITAPSQPGTHVCEWRMVGPEGAFGDFSQAKPIQVE